MAIGVAIFSCFVFLCVSVGAETECRLDEKGNLDASCEDNGDMVGLGLLQSSERVLLSHRRGTKKPKESPFSDRKHCHEVGNDDDRAVSKCLPDIMFLGVSKCGSTSIVAYMLAHPQIIMQTFREGAYGWSVNGTVDGQMRAKETRLTLDKNFFWESHVFDKHLATDLDLENINWKTAPNVPSQDVGRYLQMHYTPNYFYFPDTPFHIADIYPNAREIKYFVILREPVSRAVSSWKFHTATTMETRSFKKVLEDGFNQRRSLESCYAKKVGNLTPLVSELPAAQQRVIIDTCFWGSKRTHDTTLPMETPLTLMHAHVDKGIYVDQLRRWHSIVGKENVFVFSLEEWIAQPRAMYDQIAEFAGYTVIGTDGFKNEHEVDRVLSKQYNDGGAAENLFGVPEPAEPNPELKQQLAKFYEPYTEELFELVGRRLWKPWPM